VHIVEKRLTVRLGLGTCSISEHPSVNLYVRRLAMTNWQRLTDIESKRVGRSPRQRTSEIASEAQL
jgi:hypothetical protein